MDLSQVLDSLVATAAKVLSVEAAAVLLLDEAGDRLAVAAYGLPEERAGALARDAFGTRQAIIVEDIHEDPRTAGLPPALHTALCVPIGESDPPLGTLHVYGGPADRFDPTDAERLRAVGELGATAIYAARDLVALERVDASKSSFVQIATHELRSPVTVAQSLVRTVLKGYAGSLTDQQRDIFRRVAGRLDFLESLVNDLLDLAATKAPELAEEEGPVAVNSSVGRAALLLQPRAEEKGVELKLRPCCEELAVWASEEGLDRIFSNLIGNAVKYTPSGGRVKITLGRTEDEIRVNVADTGIGIPEEAQPQIFEEFYRAPNARDFGVGTGLGLAIVKDLIDRYGGRIELESTVGKGSTFTVILPVYSVPQ